jgi:hypothetical protein
MGLAPQLPPLAGVCPVSVVPVVRLVEIMIVMVTNVFAWYNGAVHSPGYKGIPCQCQCFPVALADSASQAN